jgi:hypothetical protein
VLDPVDRRGRAGGAALDLRVAAGDAVIQGDRLAVEVSATHAGEQREKADVGAVAGLGAVDLEAVAAVARAASGVVGALQWHRRWQQHGHAAVVTLDGRDPRGQGRQDVDLRRAADGAGRGGHGGGQNDGYQHNGDQCGPAAAWAWSHRLEGIAEAHAGMLPQRP